MGKRSRYVSFLHDCALGLQREPVSPFSFKISVVELHIILLYIYVAFYHLMPGELAQLIETSLRIGSEYGS